MPRSTACTETDVISGGILVTHEMVNEVIWLSGRLFKLRQIRKFWCTSEGIPKPAVIVIGCILGHPDEIMQLAQMWKRDGHGPNCCEVQRVKTQQQHLTSRCLLHKSLEGGEIVPVP
ncbi:hypothetical protein MPER_10796 [Moniliophthora perniciosa FA553]|nr:hypothetical protein MPER_10796 [Moniliophthora perniciosa FA553]